MSSASIKYSDDTDRAFGLCGMALALYIYDAEQYLAALSADGTSRIANIAQIDRGYQDIEQRLNALGANITRQ